MRMKIRTNTAHEMPRMMPPGWGSPSARMSWGTQRTIIQTARSPAFPEGYGRKKVAVMAALVGVMLGIIIAVTSIITVVSLVQGFGDYVTNFLRGLGTNMMVFGGASSAPTFSDS